MSYKASDHQPDPQPCPECGSMESPTVTTLGPDEGYPRGTKSAICCDCDHEVLI